MTENNIGLTIGRNYRKSNISTFKPRKLGGILRKEQARPGFLLVYDHVQKNLKRNLKNWSGNGITLRESKQEIF